MKIYCWGIKNVWKDKGDEMSLFECNFGSLRGWL